MACEEILGYSAGLRRSQQDEILDYDTPIQHRPAGGAVGGRRLHAGAAAEQSPERHSVEVRTSFCGAWHRKRLRGIELTSCSGDDHQ
jgi:hypothetical protein